jgi:hypothetical protein
MTGDLEDEAAPLPPWKRSGKTRDHGFDPWEAHELGGDINTTSRNIVVVKSHLTSTFSTCHLFEAGPSSRPCRFPGNDSEGQVVMTDVEP